MRIVEFEYDRLGDRNICDAKISLANVTLDDLRFIGWAYVSGLSVGLTDHPAFGRWVCVRPRELRIKKVIFNGPATIVFWEDGTKTVIKRQPGDIFDAEKAIAIAMCIAKKVLGNKSNFNNVINKALEEARRDSDV